MTRNDNQCKNVTIHGARTVNFVCRKRDTTQTISSDRAPQTTLPANQDDVVDNNNNNGGTRTVILDADPVHHTTSTHTEGPEQATTTVTHTIDHGKPHLRTVTLMPDPSKPAMCDMCNYWWWGGAEQYQKMKEGKRHHRNHDDDDDDDDDLF